MKVRVKDYNTFYEGDLVSLTASQINVGGDLTGLSKSLYDVQLAAEDGTAIISVKQVEQQNIRVWALGTNRVGQNLICRKRGLMVEAIAPGKVSIEVGGFTLAFENNVLTVCKGEKQAASLDLNKIKMEERPVILEQFLHRLIGDEDLGCIAADILWN